MTQDRSTRFVFDGDGAYWRAKEEARRQAEAEVYVDLDTGITGTLREVA